MEKAKELARVIEGYLKTDIYVDNIDGPYAVKGIAPNEENVERLEVGRDLIPFVQIKLTPKPEYEFEDLNMSYLDIDGFTGVVYQLSEKEFSDIEKLLK